MERTKLGQELVWVPRLSALVPISEDGTAWRPLAETRKDCWPEFVVSSSQMGE